MSILDPFNPVSQLWSSDAFNKFQEYGTIKNLPIIPGGSFKIADIGPDLTPFGGVLPTCRILPGSDFIILEGVIQSTAVIPANSLILTLPFTPISNSFIIVNGTGGGLNGADQPIILSVTAGVRLVRCTAGIATALDIRLDGAGPMVLGALIRPV